MNIDEKIKRDLTQQSKEIDALIEDNLVGYMKMGFASSFSWLVKIGYVLAVLLSILMFYCGYKFFTATAQNEVFWGVCLMLSFNAQVATKLWIFMQTNRNLLSREIRIMQLRTANN